MASKRLGVGVPTIVHLFPSSSLRDGFFTLILSGLGFFPGAGLFARAVPSDTVDPARRDGFLCVISDLSTFRSPFVTDSPLLSSEKTAPRPEGVCDAPASAASVLTSRTGGGPGGGGGGGAPPAGGGGGGADVPLDKEADLATSIAGSPAGFHGTPLEKCCFRRSDRLRKIW